MKNHFNFRSRLKSFRYAFKGIIALVKTQHNVWIHLSITFAVIMAGILLNISLIEWLFIICAISMVLVAEGFNSAVEFLGDALTKQHHELIEKAKDIGAGSVLIAAFAAAAIGLIVFLPHVSRLFR